MNLKQLLLGVQVLASGIFLASASPAVFTIDNSQTVIAVSGVIAGFPFSQQGSGSLTTSYSGNINADLSSSTVQFTGGSAISAQNNGTWQPGLGGASGSAPANYGAYAVAYGVIPVYGALRNIVLDMTSPALPVIGGNFDGNSLIFSLVTNTAALDYKSSVTGGGSLALDGDSTNTIVGQATISTNAGVRTLSFPINTTFVFSLLSTGDSSVHLTGQIVATNSISGAVQAPIIHSLTIANQNIMVAAENATAQSQLLMSSNLTSWLPASVTIKTNGSGWIIFTTPMRGPRGLFRVQQ